LAATLSSTSYIASADGDGGTWEEEEEECGNVVHEELVLEEQEDWVEFNSKIIINSPATAVSFLTCSMKLAVNV
jgi:hypothetical protein